MASFNIQFPDNKQTEVVLYMSTALGYQTQVPSGNTMIPNPETRAVFCKRKLGNYMKSLVEEGAKIEDAKNTPTTAQSSISSVTFT